MTLHSISHLLKNELKINFLKSGDLDSLAVPKFELIHEECAISLDGGVVDDGGRRGCVEKPQHTVNNSHRFQRLARPVCNDQLE